MPDNIGSNLSPDDALEETNDQDYDTKAGQHEPLAEDNDRPFTPADESPMSAIPENHPALDSNLDEHQLYDEGVSSASEVSAHSESNEAEKDEAADLT